MSRLTTSSAADRSTIARLGGLARWKGVSAEERSADARKRAYITNERHPDAALRGALVRHGKLASTRKSPRD